MNRSSAETADLPGQGQKSGYTRYQLASTRQPGFLSFDFMDSTVLDDAGLLLCRVVTFPLLLMTGNRTDAVLSSPPAPAELDR